MTTQGNGVIVLASFSDVLTVTGNIVFGGGNTGPGSLLCPALGCLAGGTIYASGNFTQLGTNSSESFHAGDFNTVYFVGTGAQTLSFTNTGSGPGTSHFANIGFDNTSLGVTLGSNIYAHCDLLSSAGPAAAVVIGNGNTLTVGGLGASDLQLQRVLLVYDGVPDAHSTGIFSGFNNVTFQGYMATDIQLDVIHPGAASPFIFNNITFTNPPIQGVGAYVRTTDSDGLLPELEINLTVAAPLTCSGADFIAGAQSDIIASCSMQFDDITAGRAHACGITVTGAAYCWGNNAVGQLGDGTNTESLVPVPVSGGLTFREISAGSDHTCAITTTTSDGYCWGANLSGQLGDASNTDRSAPVLVFGSTGMLVQISAGSEHTCAVTIAGAGYCWGKNTEGQLGDGGITSNSVPVPVSGPVFFTSISAGTGPSGSAHTCGLDTGNVAYCWGDNKSGQLGDGTNLKGLVPTVVSGVPTYGYLASGNQYTCGVTEAGTGECWGLNADGQLGDGTTTPSNTPVSVIGLSGLDGISTGSRFSCASTDSGAVYCWGDNFWGQLGDGTNINSSSPIMVTGGWILPDLGTAVSEHMCAVTGSGAMFCWGRGLNGRLGNGGTADSNVPVLVSGT